MNRILIVEDEKPISELIRLNLTDAGYACFCAYDGEQAATLLESNLYDLILLDVMLPKINGFELLEYIRPLQIPVIFHYRQGTCQRSGQRPAPGSGRLYHKAL